MRSINLKDELITINNFTGLNIYRILSFKFMFFNYIVLIRKFKIERFRYVFCLFHNVLDNKELKKKTLLLQTSFKSMRFRGEINNRHQCILLDITSTIPPNCLIKWKFIRLKKKNIYLIFQIVAGTIFCLAAKNAIFG